ncbi:MAG: bacillithiol system redox-active protein YtxJ [Candidatus Hydrogenedentota bacterium]
MLNWLKGLVLGPGKHSLKEYGVIELKCIEDLDRALDHSAQTSIAIYKHSTTCPLSAAAHRQVAQYHEQAGGSAAPVYLVKVIEARPVSNEIARRLGVRHQSPQFLVVDDGVAVKQMAHGAISTAAIQMAIEEAAKKS